MSNAPADLAVLLGVCGESGWGGVDLDANGSVGGSDLAIRSVAGGVRGVRGSEESVGMVHRRMGRSARRSQAAGRPLRYDDGEATPAHL